MKTKILKELPLILLVIAPLIYLLSIWNTLPAEVPMHYDISGKIDRYGSKTELLIFTLSLPLFVYLIFLFIPRIDPKGKIKAMGNKYFRLKFVIVLFMSVLSAYIVYAAGKGTETNGNGILAVLGLLFMFLGNYFQSLKPNYFIGIRTPWTLENETVWKETHKIAGKIWLVSGLVIIMLSFLLKPEIFTYAFLGVIAVMVLVPVVFSYKKYRELKKPA